MKYALIVIDMQNGVFGLRQEVFEKEKLVRQIKAAIGSARKKGVHIIFTRHENASFLRKGTQAYAVIDQLEVLKSDTVIEKKHPNIFDGTGLDDFLKENNISSVVITGLVSNGCVLRACLSALERSYQVVLLKDAHSTFYKNADKIIGKVNAEIEKAGATVAPAEDFLKCL